jgi:hypothetical protein
LCRQSICYENGNNKNLKSFNHKGVG